MHKCPSCGEDGITADGFLNSSREHEAQCTSCGIYYFSEVQVTWAEGTFLIFDFIFIGGGLITLILAFVYPIFGILLVTLIIVRLVYAYLIERRGKIRRILIRGKDYM